MTGSKSLNTPDLVASCIAREEFDEQIQQVTNMYKIMIAESKQEAIEEGKRFASKSAEELSIRFDVNIKNAMCEVGDLLRRDLDQVFGIARGAAEKRYVDEAISQLRLDLSEQSKRIDDGALKAAEMVSILGADLQNAVDHMRYAASEVEKRQFERHQQQQADIQAQDRDIRQQLAQDIKYCEQQLVREMANVDAKLHEGHAVTGVLDSRITANEERVKAFDAVTAQIDSLPTRRVDWMIQGASRLHALDAGTSWRSHKFNVAGYPDMQLEFKFIPASDGQSQNEGDCLLQLWGCAGLRALVKLYVGSMAEEIQCTFDDETPCSMRRCHWKDAVELNEDTLRVGMEILEGFRLVECAAQELLPVNDPLINSQGRAVARSDDQRLPCGFISLHRYMCPNITERVLSLQDQWERLRSRMVGRVEWNLEQVILLQRCFPKGNCLCSPVFSAGGFEDLQLVFYPSGDDSARECYCSFFLHCPQESALQCWLSVGKTRREAPRLREKLGRFGRSNFSLFEACVDRGADKLTLVLEIAEGQQHGAEVQKPSPQVVPWPPMLATNSISDLQQEPATVLPYEELIETSSRVHGTPGRITLEDVKHLPAIWTAKPRGIQDACSGEVHSQQLPPVWTYEPRSSPALGRDCGLFGGGVTQAWGLGLRNAEPPGGLGMLPEAFSPFSELRAPPPKTPDGARQCCASPRRRGRPKA